MIHSTATALSKSSGGETQELSYSTRGLKVLNGNELSKILRQSETSNDRRPVTGPHSMRKALKSLDGFLVRVSLGLSFHNKESLDEAVGSLQFAANPITDAGSIDHDSGAHIGHDDLNPLPVMGNINQERRDDEIGGGDDAQIVDSIESEDSQPHRRQYSQFSRLNAKTLTCKQKLL